MKSNTSKWIAIVLSVTSMALISCSEEGGSPGEEKEATGNDGPKSNEKKEAREKQKEVKKAKADPAAEENLDPALKKIHPYGRALLATRKKFYRQLKKIVMNPRMPADFMKEEVKDLYDFYENKFLEHGQNIQSLGGDTRGTILKIDNYITAEPMGVTVWVEKEANRLVKVNPDLGEMLLKAYSLPRCYDFALVRRNDPARAKRLGLLE